MGKKLVSHIPASLLDAGDHFKMAGQFYIITEVQTTVYGDKKILFRPLFGSPFRSGAVVVTRDTMFKVYNHKD